MPRIAVPAVPDAPPLTRTEIQTLLGRLFADSNAGPEAFSSTALALYGFCDTADVDAALDATMQSPMRMRELETIRLSFC